VAANVVSQLTTCATELSALFANNPATVTRVCDGLTTQTLTMDPLTGLISGMTTPVTPTGGGSAACTYTKQCLSVSVAPSRTISATERRLSPSFFVALID